MLDKIRLLVLSAILGTSYGDGLADCTLPGIGSTNAKGIDTTFMKQVAVPVNGLGWTDSGANIQFDTFNCAQVIKTGDAFTSMVKVGIRPVNNSHLILFSSRIDTDFESQINMDSFAMMLREKSHRRGHTMRSLSHP